MKWVITILSILNTTLLSGQNWGIINSYPYEIDCLVAYNMTYTELETQLLQGDSIEIEYGLILPEVEEYFGGEYAFTIQINHEGSFPLHIMAFTEPLPDNWDSYNTVGHETIHLLQYINEHYYIDFINEVESTAYMFEYLTNQIHRIITKE